MGPVSSLCDAPPAAAATADPSPEDLLQTMYLFPVPALQIASDGQVSFMNPRATQLLLTLGLLHCLDDGWALLSELDPGLCRQAMARAGRPGTIAEQQRVTRSDPCGRVVHLALTVAHVTDRQCMVVIEDLTRMVLQERELHRQQSQIAAVLGSIQGYCVCNLDTDGRVTDWNLSVQRTLGWDADAFVGQALSDLMDEEVDLAAHRSHAVQAGWSAFEGPMRSADGRTVWVDAIVSAMLDDDGQCSGFCLVARDITERHVRERQLLAGAQQDPLTGLANRRGLDAQAGRLLAQMDRDQTAMSVAAFDIDHFKKVNDGIGHAGGDAVLQHFAALLKRQLREHDVLARVGGEEFVLLLRGLAAPAALAVLERLRATVEASPAAWQGQPVPFTVSIGVATRAPGEPLAGAWEHADRALYEAKNAGRNRVVAARETLAD
jgi:diguanylate cyclase (GGDEF)-like protein/PAS domain S-box-containing protein